MVEYTIVQNQPRFTGENLAKNVELRQRVQQIADSKKCSLNQLALAWVHHKGKDIVPIPGMWKSSNSPDQLRVDNPLKWFTFFWLADDFT
jgi:aryl-alcohol dehydrogenase-like predicted oxidoreductase